MFNFAKLFETLNPTQLLTHRKELIAEHKKNRLMKELGFVSGAQVEVYKEHHLHPGTSSSGAPATSSIHEGYRHNGKLKKDLTIGSYLIFETGVIPEKITTCSRMDDNRIVIETDESRFTIILS
jgi:hypothetical protein